VSLSVETETMIVEFETINLSFTHEFGTKKETGFEIKKIEIYSESINDWVDVTNINNAAIQAKAEALIKEEL
jgi:hypothetical protein